ncbi:copper resistance CopC family protein [Nocardiopsis sp. B62]|uniref:copper resistance CopC family protein n=1 Tax=Nocardiopsis sp. B62 TaxID=2824874 RepID=UPI001B36A15C|nr:copper resistance CopC family protein [Nocardiopsis sp. B62]MBQ1083230.1 copper resistance protein CopC [Nocardiopsis sp. B62]
MRGIPGLLCAVTTAVVLTPAPALAHDTLLSSVPGDEQAVPTAPDEVRLTFSGEPMDVSTAVLVLDSEAEPVATTEPLVDGHEVSVELPPDLADGGYAVRWRVVSSDGHPISGALTFEVGEGGPPPPDLEAAPANETDGEDAAAAPSPNVTLPREAVMALAGALTGLLIYAAALRLRRPTDPRRPMTQHTRAEQETR